MHRIFVCNNQLVGIRVFLGAVLIAVDQLNSLLQIHLALIHLWQIIKQLHQDTDLSGNLRASFLFTV